MSFVKASPETLEIIQSANKDNTIFVLLAGTTEVSLVPGISSAGASPELTALTPTVDSEIVMRGKCYSLGVPPMTPEGIPTPAIVSWACLSSLKIPVLIVDTGMKIYPMVPYLYSNLGQAVDPRKGDALPKLDESFELGRYLAQILDGNYENIILAETIPGGTTTAYFVLNQIGFDLKTSSSLSVDPSDAKALLLSEAVKSRGRPVDDKDAIRKYGDYMLATATSMALETKRSRIILAGGTQMVVVYVLARKMGATSDLYLGTTKWVYGHRTETISLIPENKLIVSNPDFNVFREEGLRLYEKGNVREGVGMGACLSLFKASGYSDDSLYRSISSAYASLSKPSIP